MSEKRKLSVQEFGGLLKSEGFDFFSGVPCSFLRSLINYAINECDYIAAANEGDAVSTIAGANLAGRKGVVLMQNSGLSNAVSPLTSLTHIFKIPVLGFISWRGEPGVADEPQHALMGEITTKMLEDMKISWQYLDRNLHTAKKQLIQAQNTLKGGNSFFFVVRKDTFNEEELKPQRQKRLTITQVRMKSGKDEKPYRNKVISLITEMATSTEAVIATTGYTGRELFEAGDRPNNFYMVGSMGCASPFGLGVALGRPKKNVIVIDGDGALIMRLGALTTNGYYSPKNLLHIVLDNNCYESTGCQATLSKTVNFSDIAASCGYVRSRHIHNIQDLKKEIAVWKRKPCLTLLHMKIRPGVSKSLGRPSIQPPEVAKRFNEFLAKV